MKKREAGTKGDASVRLDGEDRQFHTWEDFFIEGSGPSNMLYGLRLHPLA